MIGLLEKLFCGVYVAMVILWSFVAKQVFSKKDQLLTVTHNQMNFQNASV